jgi:hypothetical protein
MRTVIAGLGLTLGVTLIAWLVWGTGALAAVVATGVLATVIEVWAVARLRRGVTGTTAEFFLGFAQGMLLRLAGVGLLAVAVVVDPELFPPLPAAAGFLGVLLPLLFSEVRFAR